MLVAVALVLLLVLMSLTVQSIVRVPAVVVVVLNVMDSSAASHWASVAVAPAENRTNCPPLLLPTAILPSVAALDVKFKASPLT